MSFPKMFAAFAALSFATVLVSGADENGAKLNAQDQKFMMEAAKGNMMEVHMGHMGQEKGSSAAVKTFSQQLIDDHSKAGDELMALARRKGVTLPPDNSSSMSSPLSSKTGSEFDSAFAKDMIADHHKDIAMFQKEANSGSDPDVKAWASKSIPTLQSHLDMAKALSHK